MYRVRKDKTSYGKVTVLHISNKSVSRQERERYLRYEEDTNESTNPVHVYICFDGVVKVSAPTE